MRGKEQIHVQAVMALLPARRESSRRFPPFFMNNSEYRSLLAVSPHWYAMLNVEY